MEIETTGLGAGSYPDAPEIEEYADDDLKEALEYEEYMDQCLEEELRNE